MKFLLYFCAFFISMIFAYDLSEYHNYEIGFQNEKLLNESCTDMDKAVQCELDTTDIFIGRLTEE